MVVYGGIFGIGRTDDNGKMVMMAMPIKLCITHIFIPNCVNWYAIQCFYLMFCHGAVVCLRICAVTLDIALWSIGVFDDKPKKTLKNFIV